MIDYEKIIKCAYEELEKLADAGFSSGNLDKAMRLSDIIKDMAGAMNKETTTGAMNDYTGAKSSRMSWDDAPAMQNGDWNYKRYMDAKKEYRYNQTPEAKRRLLECTEAYMNANRGTVEGLIVDMENMAHDAECAEERSVIQRHIDRAKGL